MKKNFWGLALILTVASAFTVAAGDIAPSIRQLLASGHDYEHITVRGHIVREVERGELYVFSDGSATILLKVDHKHWPYPVSISDKTLVEASGEFDFEDSGHSKLKVFNLREVK